MRAASANNTGWEIARLGWVVATDSGMPPWFLAQKKVVKATYPATFALSPCFGGFLLASGKSAGEYERTMDKDKQS